MSRSSTIILLGALVILVPFSGLPGAIRTLLEVILGLIVFSLGIAERSRAVRLSRAAHEAAERPEASPAPHEISRI